MFRSSLNLSDDPTIWAGNMVGIDPHKHTLSAVVPDGRGGLLAQSHFNVSGEDHRALDKWALGFGPVARWGVESSVLLGGGHS